MVGGRCGVLIFGAVVVNGFGFVKCGGVMFGIGVFCGLFRIL